MEDRSKVKDIRNRQVVINIEESFANNFSQLADKEGISVSTLGRRLVIRHLMNSGALPAEAVIDTLL